MYLGNICPNCSIDKPAKEEAKRPSDATDCSPSFVVIGTCACGQPATVEARTGISPGVWSEPKKCCRDCWQNELPKIPSENV